jgi:UDP-N-acetylmuramoyl-L-alanyl-D-glutamate--2,6-diaminopimelate ligase
MNTLLAETTLVEVDGDPAVVDVRGIQLDSRLAGPGDLFCCIPGARDDGHRFAADAVARGATAVLCEHRLSGLGVGVVQAVVAPGTVRAAMAHAAATLHGRPAERLVMAGVTGTNAKTTVATLLGSVFAAAGWDATVLGTLSGERTTPEAPYLQAILAEAVERAQAAHRTGSVAMEVSSHALAQDRVAGVRFDVAVFTNLSQDHLDFHSSMEAYGETKLRLFTPGQARIGVVNAEDPWGQRLLGRAPIPLVPVTGDIATDRETGVTGSSFTWRGQRVHLRLVGAVNVGNALLAAEAAHAVGVDPDAVVEGLAAVAGVPGRFEVLASAATGAPYTVMVDYAHTPVALEVALREARALAGPGRVLVVFGCGGDRDAEKRPEMGRVAVAGADVRLLTTDNPRSEDPSAIARAVIGAEESAAFVLTPDRREAIALALELAEPGDVVLVAGKGHETTQDVGGVRHAFDDRAVVRELLEGRV